MPQPKQPSQDENEEASGAQEASFSVVTYLGGSTAERAAWLFPLVAAVLLAGFAMATRVMLQLSYRTLARERVAAAHALVGKLRSQADLRLSTQLSLIHI